MHLLNLTFAIFKLQHIITDSKYRIKDKIF